MRSRGLALIVLITAAAASLAQPNRVKVGILKSMVRDAKGPKFEVLSANFEKVLKQQTGLDGDLVVVETADELRRQLADGSTQLGAFHGYEFAWAVKPQPELVPLMVAAPDAEALRALVAVRKDDPAKDVGELRGKKLALPRDVRAYSRLYLERLCRKAGADVGQIFTSTEASEGTQDALDDVVDGVAQAAVADAAALKSLRDRKPARAGRLRVLAESEPFPPAVIAYQKGKLDPAVVERFRRGMSTAHNSPQGEHLMTQIRVLRFETVPADFTRKLTAVAEAYPPA